MWHHWSNRGIILLWISQFRERPCCKLLVNIHIHQVAPKDTCVWYSSATRHHVKRVILRTRAIKVTLSSRYDAQDYICIRERQRVKSSYEAQQRFYIARATRQWNSASSLQIQRKERKRRERGRETERTKKLFGAVVISGSGELSSVSRHILAVLAITTPRSPLCAFLCAPSSPFPRIIAPFSARFILFSFRLHAERSATRPTILFISKDSLIVSGMQVYLRASKRKAKKLPAVLTIKQCPRLRKSFNWTIFCKREINFRKWLI